MMRLLFGLFAVLSLALPSSAQSPIVKNLWPGKAPGEVKELPPEADQDSKPGQLAIRRLGNVSIPQLTVSFPPTGKANGTAVVVAPGGGYSILAMEHEGTEVATWLNSLGITAVVLKYRVPKREMQSPENLAMLQDAQRTLGLVRANAKEWNLDPKRIGMLGFSAGGHLTASLCTNYESRAYDAVDAADKESCRPDFAILVYPGGVIGKDGILSKQLAVSKDTPPMFFAHASDDPVSSENSIALYRALKSANVPAELHLYASGGHGFGLRPGKGPASSWPARAADWMTNRGVLK